MKKFILLLLLSVSMVLCYAEITPYGSARISFMYENENDDYSKTGESRLKLNYNLQSNSRFGVNFTQEKLSAKIEYGASSNINLRLLYAKYNFDNWSILIGQANDGTNQYAAQVWGNDTGLIGYGAVDGSRNPQVKLEFNNGFYLSLIKPKFVDHRKLDNLQIDELLPRINVGYNLKIDNLKILPTFVFQQVNYNEDYHKFDYATRSLLLSNTIEYKVNPLLLRGQLNYGINTGNMGYKGPANLAVAEQDKTEDTSTLSGFLQFAYKLHPGITIDTGIGYATSSNEYYQKDDAQMAFYIQTNIKIDKLKLIPEIGLIDKMKDKNGNKEGSMLYAGTQLRLDF
ncbi:MAG: hypothetical protein PHY08_02125 [Candidatus Cloacimonetes bacterium]|nr:hypothetical protein [Candidatus Cloacimonadota bacterium]MDD4155345.1 hypothetical protein [Candidatus Cloacimonadota bacterium]